MRRMPSGSGERVRERRVDRGEVTLSIEEQTPPGRQRRVGRRPGYGLVGLPRSRPCIYESTQAVR